jgi:CP family cyanate transporter-like MFS transporter
MPPIESARQVGAFTGAIRVVGVLMVAATLRPPVAGVGPLLPDIRRALGLSGSAAGLLTALPVFCFGLAAFAGPYLARRFGLERTIGVVLLLIGAGLAIRSSGTIAELYLGTTVLALATAVANVLLPAIVKADFPKRVGVMTGSYTTVMSGGAAVSALVAVPIAVALGGWRPALAVWLLLVVIAFLVWLPQLRGSSQHVAVARSTLGTGLWRRPLAWAVAMYFGLQSLSFYALLNWLPSFLRDNGFSPTSAGALLSLMTIVGVPFGLLVPSIAGRRPNQRLAVAITTFVSALGLLGLAVLPRSAPVLWVTLIGLGMGATFPLALTLVALRSSNPAVTGELSAMVQGFGYLIAAAGTFFVGFLHDLTHGWGTVVLLLLILTAVQGAAGWIGGRDALVA